MNTAKKNLCSIFLLIVSVTNPFCFSGWGQNKKPISEGERILDSAYLYVFSDQKKAISLGKQALELGVKSKNHRVEVWACNAIGNAYHVMADYVTAFKYYNRGLKKSISNEFTNGEILSCVNLGYLFNDQKNDAMAKKYYRLGIAGAMKINDTTNLGNIYNNLGVIFYRAQQYDSSLYYHAKALERRIKNKSQIKIAGSYTNIGAVYFELKQFDKSLEYQLKAYEIDSLHPDPPTLVNLAAAYTQKRQFKKALYFGRKALAIGEEHMDKSTLVDLYVDLYTVYGNIGDADKVMEYATKALAYKDSISKDDTKRVIGEMSEKYESEKKELKIKGLNAEKEKQNIKIQQQWMLNITFGVGLFFILIFLIIVYRGYKQKKKSNTIISQQKLLVEEKQKEITDSISYARRIQFSLLADERIINEHLKDYFIYFMPKDIVSGDFYWCAQKNGQFYLALCDCTGHGVPGAFMSLLSISLLNEAINERGIKEPSKALDFVRERIIKSLDDGRDGLDGVLLAFDLKQGKLKAALSNNPIWVIRNGQLIVIEPDKMPVGRHDKQHIPFSQKSMDLQKGDLLILLTDGYADQFGGEKGKKFKYSGLQKFLCENEKLEMQMIKRKLGSSFESWKGDLEQIDDVCIIGIRI